METLAARSRLRRLRCATALPDGYVELDGKRLLNLCSNDYLGIGARAAGNWLQRTQSAGATASRLVVGNHACYDAVESAVAALKGTEAALVFGSGYLANCGVIPAVVGRGDGIFADRLCHASIIDGARLSGARLHRFHHNAMDHLADLLERQTGYRRRLIVTEALFSMDGDLAPLAELAVLKVRYGAMLMIDEAHSGGVFGPSGAGLAAAAGLTDRVDIQMGTFSKAYGCYGGYVAGSRVLADTLVNRARTLIFTTGLPPVVLEGIAAGMRAAAAADAERTRLAALASRFRKALSAGRLDIGRSMSQIVPVMVGDDGTAVRVADQLMDRGVAAMAIRPPTVPEGTARIRFSLTAVLDDGAVDAAAAAVVGAVRGG